MVRHHFLLDIRHPLMFVCAFQCNRSMSPNFLFTWPHAQIGVGDISQSSDYNRLTKISAEDSTQRLLDDGLILPHQTKKVYITNKFQVTGGQAQKLNSY